MNESINDIPPELKKWLAKVDIKQLDYLKVESNWPFLQKGGRKYILVSPKLSLIANVFDNHDYNPRKPSSGRINELRASISQLSLLSPLTCALLPKSELQESKENVVLLDGRHRFEAIKQLHENFLDWKEDPRVDLKIFYGLDRSDLLILATYMNRTRRNLKKGEYYKAVVGIYENKEEEFISNRGIPPMEKEVFDAIEPGALQDKMSDLSIGRIVGIIGFDPEEYGRWVPNVGTYQGDKYQSEDGLYYYCALTAGNLAVFLRHICQPSPYEDHGERRNIEIANVSKLGEFFNSYVFNERITKRDDPKKSSVASKYWVMHAFGSILEDYRKRFSSENYIMSDPNVNLNKLSTVIREFGLIMEKQATIIKKYMTDKRFEDLKRANTYQTELGQVKPWLLEELKIRLPDIFGDMDE
jgi:hypothetical protein